MDADDAIAARLVGQTVGGRWRLERLLGTGGMAAVFAARDNDNNVAAVKILHPEMSLRHDVRERFLREAYVANRVAHPGAVRVLEHSADESGSTYLAMELLEGEPLSTRVRRVGKLPVPELVDYMDQILDVLAHAHDQGIIHRDLKPDNLFITNNGRVKILDFGLARMLDDVPGDFKTRTGMALGTLPYMAPEQALGRRSEVDGRVDLFALGATVFRILAGRKVHEADSEAELLIAMASKPAPPLASVAPDTPPGLCSIVDLSLAFSRDARYPDARTMQSDVRALREGASPPYATSRSAAREESTRIDMPAVPLAVAQRNAPARGHDPATAATEPAARPINPGIAGGTAVLPQMPAAAVHTPAALGPPGPQSTPGAAPPPSTPGAAPPPSTPGAAPPPSTPGAAPPPSTPGGALAGASAIATPAAAGTLPPNTPAVAVATPAGMPATRAAPPPGKKRSLLPWLLGGAFVLLLIGGAIAAAAFYFVENDSGALPELQLSGSSTRAATSSAPSAPAATDSTNNGVTTDSAASSATTATGTPDKDLVGAPGKAPSGSAAAPTGAAHGSVVGKPSVPQETRTPPSAAVSKAFSQALEPAPAAKAPKAAPHPKPSPPPAPVKKAAKPPKKKEHGRGDEHKNFHARH